MLPSASSFGRRIEDVKLMAARWKDNLEACLKLYPIIIAMAPGIFSAVKVSPGDHHGLLSASEGTASSSDEKGMIEDMTVGYEWLNSVKIRFVHRVLAKALASNELKVPTVKPPAAPPIITDGDNINPVIASSAVSNEGKQRRPSQRILRRVGQPKHVVEMTEMLQQIIPASKALDSSTASEDRKTKTVAELLFQFMGNHEWISNAQSNRICKNRKIIR